eukprot:m.448776 g.448776  ORF g.448776 m.448776 type:complete len:160 (+) comp19709_c0_seq1:1048-1527(+)
MWRRKLPSEPRIENDRSQATMPSTGKDRKNPRKGRLWVNVLEETAGFSEKILVRKTSMTPMRLFYLQTTTLNGTERKWAKSPRLVSFRSTDQSKGVDLAEETMVHREKRAKATRKNVRAQGQKKAATFQDPKRNEKDKTMAVQLPQRPKNHDKRSSFCH